MYRSSAPPAACVSVCRNSTPLPSNLPFRARHSRRSGLRDAPTGHGGDDDTVGHVQPPALSIVDRAARTHAPPHTSGQERDRLVEQAGDKVTQPRVDYARIRYGCCRYAKTPHHTDRPATSARGCQLRWCEDGPRSIRQRYRSAEPTAAAHLGTSAGDPENRAGATAQASDRAEQIGLNHSHT